jgi:hypothetical protein
MRTQGKNCKLPGLTPIRIKRDYDIVTLTVPGVLTNVTYFDVTRYRYVAPHSY